MGKQLLKSMFVVFRKKIKENKKDLMLEQPVFLKQYKAYKYVKITYFGCSGVNKKT